MGTRVRDDLDDIERLDVLPTKIRDPRTKKEITLDDHLECIPETVHETGMIICKEKKQSKKALAVAILVNIAIIIASIFLFSVKITVKSSVATLYTAFVSFLPQVIAVVMILVGVIVAAKARR